MNLDRLKPAVPKRWLLIIAGVLWDGVGLLLLRLAIGWLSLVHRRLGLELALLGVGSALPMYRFGFSHIVEKNIRRMNELSDRVCVFAFQAWRGYAIIAFMMALGYTLRHSGLPKEYLACVYLMIGSSLILGSLLFYREFWNSRRKSPM
jgi:hypothetical protein